MWKACWMLPVGVGVGRGRLAAGVQGEAVAPAEHAEHVVERVVLHHQHHDVVDAGQRVGAGREIRVRQRSGQRAAPSGPVRAAPRMYLGPPGGGMAGRGAAALARAAPVLPSTAGPTAPAAISLQGAAEELTAAQRRAAAVAARIRSRHVLSHGALSWAGPAGRAANGAGHR